VIRDADLAALIDIAYAAAANPDAWLRFLERLHQLLDAHIVALFVQDLQTPGGAFSHTHGMAPEWQRAYRDYYGARNPWMAHGYNLQRVRTSEERCPTSELVKTEFYADFLRRIDVAHGVGGTILRDGSLVANITVLRKRGAFGDEGRKVIATLIPHLRRALRAYRRLAVAELEERALMAALDRLPCGVLLVARDGQPLFVNREAQRILTLRDGLSITREGLTAGRPVDTRMLRGLIARAATAGAGGGVMALGRPSALRAFGVEVVPLTLAADALPAPRVVSVFVVDPERRHETHERVLARFYDLTPAESGLAARLAAGDTLQQAADVRQIAQETARTHLKRILRKTGARRQTELVLRLHEGPLAIATTHAGP
jgi:DNA-binding CsgD family transcriptional regulator